MERGSKNKFKMKSAPLRAEETIAGRFMAMGRALGNSKTSDPVEIDPSKYYKAPKKTANKDVAGPKEDVVKTKKKPIVRVQTPKELRKKHKKEGNKITRKERKKASEVNDYVIPPVEEAKKIDPNKEINLDTSKNFMSAMSAFPMKYGRKK